MMGGAKVPAVGSKLQVWNGNAKHTSGGLTRKDLMRTKRGRIVSRRKHAAGQKAIKNLRKAGYVAKKGTFKLFSKKRGGSVSGLADMVDMMKGGSDSKFADMMKGGSDSKFADMKGGSQSGFKGGRRSNSFRNMNGGSQSGFKGGSQSGFKGGRRSQSGFKGGRRSNSFRNMSGGSESKFADMAAGMGELAKIMQAATPK
jgi:hypothetical protein